MLCLKKESVLDDGAMCWGEVRCLGFFIVNLPSFNYKEKNEDKITDLYKEKIINKLES